MTFHKDTQTGETFQAVQAGPALKQSIEFLNTVAVQLKDRNCVGPKRKDLEETRDKLLLNLINLVAGAIQAGVFTSDEHKILTANVSSKTFKDAGRVNAILKKHLAEKGLEQKDKMLSDVELAKLIETPYVSRSESDPSLIKLDLSKFNAKGVQEITEDQVPTPTDDGRVTQVNSNHADDKATVIDKVNRIAYINLQDPNTGEDKWYAKSLRRINNWYNTAKDLCVSVFGYIWKKLQEWACFLIKAALVAIFAILGVTLAVADGILGIGAWSWKKVTGLFSKKETQAQPQQQPDDASIHTPDTALAS